MNLRDIYILQPLLVFWVTVFFCLCFLGFGVYGVMFDVGGDVLRPFFVSVLTGVIGWWIPSPSRGLNKRVKLARSDSPPTSPEN